MKRREHQIWFHQKLQLMLTKDKTILAVAGMLAQDKYKSYVDSMY